MSDNTQQFLYDFGVKYWDIVDADKSGSLDYDEYKYTMAAFAAVDARVILGAFDGDNNGILTGSELTELRQFVTTALTSNSWNPSANDINAVKAAWANAQGQFLKKKLILKLGFSWWWRQLSLNDRTFKIHHWNMERPPPVRMLRWSYTDLH